MVAYTVLVAALFVADQRGGRPRLCGPRPAPAAGSEAMTAPVVENPASVPASEGLILGTAPPRRPVMARRAASPLRAAWGEFKENRIAAAALAVVLGIFARWPRALDHAPGSVRHREPEPHGCPPAAGPCRVRGIHALARHRRQRPRPPLRDPLRPSDLDPDGPDGRHGGSRDRHDARHRRGLSRRQGRDRDHARGRPAALGRRSCSPRPGGAPRPGQGAAHSRTRGRAICLFARTAHGAAAAERRKDYVEPRSPCRSAAGASSSATSFRT